jgi:hypothetical protein
MTRARAARPLDIRPIAALLLADTRLRHLREIDREALRYIADCPPGRLNDYHWRTVHRIRSLRGVAFDAAGQPTGVPA